MDYYFAVILQQLFDFNNFFINPDVCIHPFYLYQFTNYFRSITRSYTFQEIGRALLENILTND